MQTVVVNRIRADDGTVLLNRHTGTLYVSMCASWANDIIIIAPRRPTVLNYILSDTLDNRTEQQRRFFFYFILISQTRTHEPTYRIVCGYVMRQQTVFQNAQSILCLVVFVIWMRSHAFFALEASLRSSSSGSCYKNIVNDIFFEFNDRFMCVLLGYWCVIRCWLRCDVIKFIIA